MEKIILLSMKDNKDISIAVNGEEKLIIKGTNRNIAANAIYELLDYREEDTYIVKSENQPNMDTPVLGFFTNLIKDITDRLKKVNN